MIDGDFLNFFGRVDGEVSIISCIEGVFKIIIIVVGIEISIKVISFKICRIFEVCVLLGFGYVDGDVFVFIEVVEVFVVEVFGGVAVRVFGYRDRVESCFFVFIYDGRVIVKVSGVVSDILLFGDYGWREESEFGVVREARERLGR